MTSDVTCKQEHDSRAYRRAKPLCFGSQLESVYAILPWRIHDVYSVLLKEGSLNVNVGHIVYKDQWVNNELSLEGPPGPRALSHEANLPATNCSACYRTTLVALEHFVKTCLTIPKNKMWTFKCKWILFLEIAWNWLPVYYYYYIASCGMTPTHHTKHINRAKKDSGRDSLEVFKFWLIRCQCSLVYSIAITCSHQHMLQSCWQILQVHLPRLGVYFKILKPMEQENYH